MLLAADAQDLDAKIGTRREGGTPAHRRGASPASAAARSGALLEKPLV
jgi:hypothetical protein